MDTSMQKTTSLPTLKNLITDSGEKIPFKHLLVTKNGLDLRAPYILDIDAISDDHYTVKPPFGYVTVSLATMQLHSDDKSEGLCCEALKIKELTSSTVTDAGEIIVGHRFDTNLDYTKQIHKKLVQINDAMMVVNGISMTVNGVGYILDDNSYEVKQVSFYAVSDKALTNTDHAVFITAAKDIEQQVFSAIMDAHFVRIGRFSSHRRDAILDCLKEHYPNQEKAMTGDKITELVEILANNDQLSDLSEKERRAAVQVVLSNYDYYASLYRGKNSEHYRKVWRGIPKKIQ